MPDPADDDGDVTGSLRLQVQGCPLHVLRRAQRAVDQQPGLIEIGGDHRGAGKQLAHQRLHRRFFDQHGATGGDHDRIEHYVLQRVPIDRLGNRTHNLGRMQHADLDGVGADVLDDGIDLVAQHLRRHAVDGPHAAGVLRGECGNGGHAVAAQRGNGFQVGLDPGATAAVRTGDGKDAGVFESECGCGHLVSLCSMAFVQGYQSRGRVFSPDVSRTAGISRLRFPQFFPNP